MFDLSRKSPPAVARREHIPEFSPVTPVLDCDELAYQLEGLTRLHELAMRLGGIVQEEPALQAILDVAVDSQGAQFGLIWVHEPDTGALVARASRGFSEASLLEFDRIMPGPRGGSAGKAFARRSRWVIEDIDGDSDFAAFRPAAHAAGFRAVHSTPIITRAGDLLGVVSVHFREPYIPRQRDMQMADVCARNVADVIESHRSQEAARHNERVYKALGESLDFGVWSADSSGGYTYMSDCFLQLVGRRLEECVGDRWKDLLHPEDREPVAESWRACVAEGRKWDCELRVQGRDGAYYSMLARAVPVRDARGVIVSWAGINLDIGRLKRVETELRQNDQRKNEFLATLAHELRNPLAPLRNGLEVLKLAGPNAATSDRAREMMERQMLQLVRLVDDLLDVSRVSRGKVELRRERIELSAVLRNAIETSQPVLAERRHQFIARIPAEKIVVDADMTRLSQVFWNLLNNAAKYTPNGGRVEMEVRILDGEVAVSVRDNGFGIPPAMQSRIFEIFTQVDRELEKSQGGLGIGLSIAKRLVEMHGGRIDVSSAGPGAGSEFTVRLPAFIETHRIPNG
ncbi:MAG TPA: ATP-binding protein [Usitatibacter sp.]|nr:ATP-binding protein [Usitatibacter sp.]